MLVAVVTLSSTVSAASLLYWPVTEGLVEDNDFSFFMGCSAPGAVPFMRLSEVHY